MSTSQLSRRSLVTTAAALPALALPTVVIAVAAAAEPDPIYAAIEKYRATEAAFLARCYFEEGLEEALPPAEGETYRTPEMVSLVDAGWAARSQLAQTSPTTLAGLAAYLDFVVSETDRLDDGELLFQNEDALQFMLSLARAARQMSAVQS